MKNVYTVKQVNSYIKNMFTQDFMLNRIWKVSAVRKRDHSGRCGTFV